MDLLVKQETKSSTLTPLTRICFGDLLLFLSFLGLTFWESLASQWNNISFWIASAAQVSWPFFIGLSLAGLIIWEGQNRIPQLLTQIGNPPIIQTEASLLNGKTIFFPLRIINICIWSFITVFFFKLIACKEINQTALPILHSFCQSFGQSMLHGLIGLAIGYILWVISFAYKVKKVQAVAILIQPPNHPVSFFQDPLWKLALYSLAIFTTFEVIFLALRHI